MKLFCFGCQGRIRFFQFHKWIFADGALRAFHSRCAFAWSRAVLSWRRTA